MNDLSNRLRDRASELSDVGFFATAHEMRQAADLIDQQAAEIADLKLRIDRWNSGDNSIGAKEQVKRLKAERDEWQRRASWIWLKLRIWGNNPEHMYPEAAQWFED